MNASGPTPESPNGALGSGTFVLTTLALVVAASFLIFMLVAAEAHFVPQVADLYLVCQYAKSMSEGHPFRMGPEEAPSTGATSLLHTATLALAHTLGARGEGLVAFAILLGAGCFVASVLLARRVARRLAGEREGWLAGLLVALSGPTVWGFLSGSDVAPFMLLSLWLLDGLIEVHETGSAWPAISAATLLALVRPEGLPIAILTGAALGLARRDAPRAQRLLSWLPTAAALGALAIIRLATGTWIGASVASKSLLANYGLSNTIARVSTYAVDVVRGLLLGLYPSQVPIGSSQGYAPFFFPPLGLAFVLLAAATARAGRGAIAAWLGIVVVVSALVAPSTYLGVHFNRYLMWAFPGLLVLTAVGLSTLARLLPTPPDQARWAFRAGAGLAILLGLLSTLRFATLYGESAGSIYLREVATARWIATSLPPGARIASLVTSIEYLTGRPGFSLHGVANPALAGNRAAEPEANTFEALGWIPPERRPSHLLTSVAAQEAYPVMKEMVEEPPLFQTSSLSPDEFLLFRMRWDAVGRSRRPRRPEVLDAVRGLREVDALNVCDVADEAAHGYSYRSGLGGQLLAGAVHADVYPGAEGTPPERVLDAGRMILGEERFRVRATPGRDLLVVMRTAAEMDANVLRAEATGRTRLRIVEGSLSVEVNGALEGRVAIRAGPGWNERVVRVAGALVTHAPAEVRLSGKYASFYYWIYQ